MKKLLDVLRIGIFYDGYYFYKISNFYKYEHEKKSRISISGLHEFIRNEVATVADMDARRCQIIDAHYFKGRSLARDMGEKVQSERIFEDILMRENIVSHYLPLRFSADGARVHEKGIDVWLALEAYELAIYKRFDILVLIAGDGDYVPLVRKLHTLGTQVMLVCWDFSYHNEHGDIVETKTSQQLLSEVFYPIQMCQRIDGNNSQHIRDLFVADRIYDNNMNNHLNQIGQNNLASLAARTSEPPAPVSQILIPAPESVAAPESAPLAAPVTEPAPAPDTAPEEKQPEILDPGVYVSTIMSINHSGFGFIRDEGNNNIFFHFTTLTNCEMSDLRVGMKVRYETEVDEERSGRTDKPVFRATKVTLLDLS